MKILKLTTVCIFLISVLIIFTDHDLYQISIACGMLITITVLASVLQTSTEDFFEKLEDIMRQAIATTSYDELILLRSAITEHRKKAYNTQTKYDVDRVYEYINSRLKHEFK